jgi:nicotinate dehydrogenase subunit A
MLVNSNRSTHPAARTAPLPTTTVTLRVNGKRHTVAVDPDTPLLYALRNKLGLTGPKFGCGLAQCGACTVTLDGRAIRSCVTPVSTVRGKAVVTIEGLGDEHHPDRLQQAFIAEQAAQCGYCIPGMIMSAHALLASNPHPSDADIRSALEGNLCRCGTHLRILRAVKRAAGETA